MESKYINRYHTFCRSLKNLKKSLDQVLVTLEMEGFWGFTGCFAPQYLQILFL